MTKKNFQGLLLLIVLVGFWVIVITNPWGWGVKVMDGDRDASRLQRCSSRVQSLTMTIVGLSSVYPVPAASLEPTLLPMMGGDHKTFLCPGRKHKSQDDETDYRSIIDMLAVSIPASEMQRDTPVVWDKYEHPGGSRNVGFWSMEVRAISEEEFQQLMDKTRRWVDEMNAKYREHPPARTAPAAKSD